MPPSMADIARRLGVAKSTVSLALNDKPGVSDEMRAQVIRTAKEMGYRLAPRYRVRRLSPESFAVINHVVLQSESEISGVSVGYLKGIQAFTREANINLTILSDYRGGEKQFGFHFMDETNLQPDGLILMGGAVTRDSPFIRWAHQKEIPIVVLSRNWPDSPICTVSQDHAQQSKIALDYLIDQGHRTIGFISREADRDCDWFPIRLAQYRKTLEMHTDRADDTLVSIAADGAEAVKKLLARRPDITAIFGIYDRIAVQAMVALRALGKEVPEGVSVIGLDDADPSPDGYPGLTTVGFSHIDMGYLAAELLAKKIENPEIYYGQIVVESYLVERDSCAAPIAQPETTE